MFIFGFVVGAALAYAFVRDRVMNDPRLQLCRTASDIIDSIQDR